MPCAGYCLYRSSHGDISQMDVCRNSRINYVSNINMSAMITRVLPILHEFLACVETVKNGLFCRLRRLTNALYTCRYMFNTNADLFSDRSSFKRFVSAFFSQAYFLFFVTSL